MAPADDDTHEPPRAASSGTPPLHQIALDKGAESQLLHDMYGADAAGRNPTGWAPSAASSS